MLVGDVRCATTGLGSSWKLSGGSMLSAGVTKVSKKRHVRRAISLKVRASSSDAPNWLAEVGDRLVHNAIAGAAIQSSTKGSATGHDAGAAATTAIPAATPKATPPAICP